MLAAKRLEHRDARSGPSPVLRRYARSWCPRHARRRHHGYRNGRRTPDGVSRNSRDCLEPWRRGARSIVLGNGGQSSAQMVDIIGDQGGSLSSGSLCHLEGIGAHAPARHPGRRQGRNIAWAGTGSLSSTRSKDCLRPDGRLAQKVASGAGPAHHGLANLSPAPFRCSGFLTLIVGHERVRRRSAP